MWWQIAKSLWSIIKALWCWPGDQHSVPTLKLSMKERLPVGWVRSPWVSPGRICQLNCSLPHKFLPTGSKYFPDHCDQKYSTLAVAKQTWETWTNLAGDKHLSSRQTSNFCPAFKPCPDLIWFQFWLPDVFLVPILSKINIAKCIEYFDSFNTFSSKQKLQQALKSWSNFSLVLFGQRATNT